MYLLFSYLLILFQTINCQTLMKRFTFPGNVWPHCVYKNISYAVKSKIECAALCKTESINCNFLFYGPALNICGLANLKQYNLSSVEQKGEAFGYIELGIDSKTLIKKILLEKNEKRSTSSCKFYSFCCKILFYLHLQILRLQYYTTQVGKP
jgi:hypothetical protein